MQDGSAPGYAVHASTDHHGVSWAAVFAGALAAAAVYLILLALGAGFGLSSISPWSGEGLSAPAVGASAIVWLIVTEILSSAMGGYLAGRLRTKWKGIHTDEVYFRDTAHGFLAWCTALVFTAAFLATAATALIGHAAESKSAGVTASERQSSGEESYYLGKLFRGDAGKGDVGARAEASAILRRALTQGFIPNDDRAYLNQLVSAQTGLSATDADVRVGNVFNAAQQNADAVRRGVAHSLLWMFMALLIGAFTASVAATIGGKQRDDVVLV